MAGTVNSQARLEADLQRADLVGQRQLLVEARNSRCRPWAALREGPLPGHPARHGLLRCAHYRGVL